MQNRRDPQTYAIIGAAMEVHKVLGAGFLENVYYEALAIELSERGVPFKHEVDLVVFYKQRPLQKCYRVDFVCFAEIIVELKALSHTSGQEEAQVINYLKATNFKRGLLLNFGAESLQYTRLTNRWYQSAQSA